MGKTRSVLYKAGEKTLRADDCRPLIQAIQEGGITLHALARSHYPGARLKVGEVPGVCSMGFWHVTGEQRQGLLPHRNFFARVFRRAFGVTPGMWRKDADRKALIKTP